MIKTPELDKMIACNQNSQVIGEFLEWLKGRSEPIDLCIWDESDDMYCELNMSINSLLAEYFGINEQVAEKERVAILKQLQS